MLYSIFHHMLYINAFVIIFEIFSMVFIQNNDEGSFSFHMPYESKCSPHSYMFTCSTCFVFTHLRCIFNTKYSNQSSVAKGFYCDDKLNDIQLLLFIMLSIKQRPVLYLTKYLFYITLSICFSNCIDISGNTTHGRRRIHIHNKIGTPKFVRISYVFPKSFFASFVHG